MKQLLAAFLLCAPTLALGAVVGIVSRGDLVIHSKVTGTVVAEDVFRLKSTIEGRIEDVSASSFSWKRADKPLATLAHKELAAMLDARGAQDKDLMEDRWKTVFHPTQIKCAEDCFVMKIFARPRSWVKAQAVLFEAAHNLKLVAHVRPEDAPLIRDGMTLTFWPVKNPARTLSGSVTHFALDTPSDENPGATFTMDLGPDAYLDPGTEWEGEIIPVRKTGVLIVPTAALIRLGDSTYLPVRVSTGATTEALTQITSGIEDQREVLILDDSQLRGAQRHRQTVDRIALELRRNELEGVKTPPKEKRPATTPPASIQDHRAYGGAEDPYGQQ